MVNKKRVLVLGAFVLFGIFVSLSFTSAWVDFSSIGGIKTTVNTLEGGTNWSLFNNTYNSSVMFINVTFYNNHSGLAGELDGLTFDNNSLLDIPNATILNATIYARLNSSGSAWTRVGVLTNWTTWGGGALNKSAVFGNITLDRSVLADGVYDFNVTITNSSSYNISIGNVFNLSFNVTLENDPPVVFLNNVTITYTYQTIANLSVLKNGMRNYSGTLTINATIINPGAGVQSVVFNVTNGTTKTVSYNKTLTKEGTTERYSATFDSTILTDGFYNFSITANGSGKSYYDAGGLRNWTTVASNIYIDNTAPTATLTCTPASVSSGSTETCACASSDATTSITTTYTASPSTANTGTQTTSCVVWDSAGNSYTTTTTYNVEQTGGGSSSGSSSTSSSPSVSTSTTANEIAPGTPEVLSNFADTGVKEISVSVSATASDVSVSVDKYSKVPSAVGVAKEGEVYKYLKIDTENLEGKLDKAIITIQVAKSWVASKELTKEDIAMYKFADGAWKEITTTFDSEDSNDYYYTVELTSFSYFAIGERTEQVAAPENLPEAEESGMSTTTWIIIVAVIVAIVAIAYFLMRKKK